MRSEAKTSALLKRWRAFCTSSVRATEKKAMLELWAWGKGDAGQLGAGDDRNHKTPFRVARMESPSNIHLAHMQGLSTQTPLSHIFPALEFPTGHIEQAEQQTCIDSAASQGKARSEHRTSLDPIHPPALVGISCGLFHSALLVDGELWTWGKGEAGRLGLGSELPKYTPFSNPHLENLVSVSLGGLHSAATSEDGSLYTWGFGAFGALGHGGYKAELLPRRLLLNQDKIENVVYVAGGGAHSAATTSSGDLYTWGRDEGDGRLGHGPDLVTDEGAVNVPLQVHDMPESVVSVSCGGFSTMALTAGGKTWSWGANSNYELGRGDTLARSKPSLIPEIENECVVQIACGGFHSAALTADGRVFTWGRGGNGQLGHDSWSNGRTPKVVEALANLRVVYIACGSFSTAAITETGTLYCWGKNKDHQLGFSGKLDSESVPKEVIFNPEAEQLNGNASVVAVALGACHGIGLVLTH